MISDEPSPPGRVIEQIDPKRRVLVTGTSTGGIGEGVVRKFLAEGWIVEALSRNVENWQGVPGVTAHRCDVANPQELKAVMAEVGRAGALDAVVVNAGVDGFALFDSPEAERCVSSVWATNLVGASNTAMFALPYLRPGRSALVGVSSIAASGPGIPGIAAYQASKAGLRQLFLGLQFDLAHRGVRTTTIAPGLVDTRMGDDLIERLNLDGTSPLLTPADVADAAYFAASYAGTGNMDEIVLLPREHYNREARAAWRNTMERTLPKIVPMPGISPPNPGRQLAFITGGSRGIGLALALRLARRGFHLVVLARDKPRLDEARDALLQAGAASCRVHSVDVADHAAVNRLLVESVRESRAQLKVLVSNAGINRRINAIGSTPQVHANVVNTNLISCMEMCLEGAKIMHQQETRGHIFVVGSTASRYPWAATTGMTPYYISKWGQQGMVNSLLEDLRPFGIKLTLFQLGLVNNDLGLTPGATKYVDQHARQLVSPNDVADALDFALDTKETSIPSHIVISPHGPIHPSAAEIVAAKG